VPLKIHNDDDEPEDSVAKVKPKTRRFVKKPKLKDKPAPAPEPKVRPYIVVICTLGKPPRMEPHADLASLATAIRTELRVSLPEDVRVFVIKGQQMQIDLSDDCLKWVDGDQAATIRLPLPSAELEVIKTTGELFGSNDLDISDTPVSSGGADDDFLFA
jgi:hypothetical protein